MSFGSGPRPPAASLNCGETGDLLAAFALDSLDPPATESVAAHIATCAACRTQAAELRAVAMQIGEGVEELAPPPRLKGRLLAQAHAEGRDEVAARSSAARRSTASRRSGRWSPWLATAAAALLALSAGGWGLIEHFSSPRAQASLTAVRLTPVESLIASGEATVIPLSPGPTSDAQGALVTDPGTSTTYLLLSRVPTLHSRMVYALWFMGPQHGSLAPARIGQVERAGAYRITRSQGEFTRAAVTREPHRGDTAPRGPVLLEAALS
ncbi:MAG: anti-sigma factor [Candidatus Dormiibacterota bacterium]